MSTKCQLCGVVGLTENEIQAAAEIIGQGNDSCCLECAEEYSKVCGKKIQVDLSGVGNCWKNVPSSDIPCQIHQEIECCIVDEKMNSCSGIKLSNGLSYRW